MQLPIEFTEYTRKIMGGELYAKFLSSFEGNHPVSVRLNPFKVKDVSELDLPVKEEVAWCRNAFYLTHRPDFTLDPLLHAGCYYVQEAGSMFLDHVLQTLDIQPNRALDLCAAPGGKSTLLRAALPDGCMLYSNEPDRKRANILMENLQKQGHPNVKVSNNYAADYRKSRLSFDLILCDVPCSGEGMFRKDEGAVNEWSIQNVMKCRDLQRSIIEDIWPCLNNGGILIYSTCTFNTQENEENVQWIIDNLGAELIPIPVKAEWNITGSLLGNDMPVYRFIPGVTETEGLFMAVLRKTSDDCENFTKSKEQLRILSDGQPHPTQKGKDIIPDHFEALLINTPRGKYHEEEVSLDQALHYLRREQMLFPEGCPKGHVLVTYKGHPLGFVKNIGNRANNLYPQEWRVRK